MANTHNLIQTVTVGAGGASTIVFSSIPQTFTDLKLVVSSRATGGYVDVQAVFFNDNSVVITGSRYFDSNNTGTARQGSLYYYQMLSQPSIYTANSFASGELYVSNYSSTSLPKSLYSESVLSNNASGNYLAINAGWWNSTTAITTLTIQGQNGNFVQYSSASLYGIKNS